LSIHRNQLIEELKQRGIGTSVHFIPLHTHPYYRDTWGYRQGDFPVAEDYFDRCLSLPLYPAMSDADQDRVIDALTDIAHIYGRRPKPGFPAYEESAKEKSQDVFANDGAGPSYPSANRDGCPRELPDHMLTATKQSARRSWYLRAGKRVLDCTGAAAALLAVSPVLTVCACAVWLGSPGPIFFTQRRVGRAGRTFQLLKFRSMLTGGQGPSITAAGDPRITRTGSWLRRWKLDELPQLINVLKGEMALVGPRPEVPEYVAGYTSEQRRVFELRPGITSPTSLAYIDEEEILAGQKDREYFYRHVLLPHKLEIDLAYCRDCSLAADVKVLLATVRRLLPEKHSAGKGARRRRTIAGESSV
jgi:lipopolysaccharide/colanic/teichoic acid biosynthesis glycosyltransferase